MIKYKFYSSSHDNSQAKACIQMLYHFLMLPPPDLPNSEINIKKFLPILDKNGIQYSELFVFAKSLKNFQTPFIINLSADKNLIVFRLTRRKITYADPDDGIKKESTREFLKNYNIQYNLDSLNIILFNLTPEALKRKNSEKSISSFIYYSTYLKAYKKYLIQLCVGLIVASVLQLLPPFLTQILVDKAVNFKDINLVNTILIGLLVLAIGRMTSQLIRDWISFYVGNRINISMVSDFIKRVLNQPVIFFENRTVGDILQRLSDHNRIESFLTNSIVNIIFSGINLVLFSTILGWYNAKIFLVFLSGSILYFGWTLFFFRIRKEMDLTIFHQNSILQSTQIQLFQKIQDIKLQGCENEKRKKWENIKAKLFKSQEKLIKIDQIQTVGSTLINEGKSLIILWLTARLVINNEITIGMMMAVQYILGHVNAPINQFIQFIRQAQMASISMKRLSQVSNDDSEYQEKNGVIKQLPDKRDIRFEKLSFSYRINKNQLSNTLRNIECNIPHGKITGIVGASGSGKTTLLKLLLKMYKPTNGSIRLNGININDFDTRWWRSQCGVIFQDSELFEDTIIQNIVGYQDEVDYLKLLTVIRKVRMQKEIENFPQGLQTVIGDGEQKLSSGQKQRLLIARLLYQKPEFIFLDEATNAIDSSTEHRILSNIINAFKDKTVVIITHKLSLAKYFDHVLVVENGHLIKSGPPSDLIGNEEVLNNILIAK